MADPGFPGQHTTTTTVQTSNTTVQTTIRFDPSYIKTIPGILKIVEIVLNIIGFICIEVSGSYHSRGSYFNFVCLTAFWFTGILLALYLFHVIERYYRMPWLKIEFMFCAIWAGLYLIAACFAITKSEIEAFVAAGVFGFMATAAYGLDAYFSLKAFQSGKLAQGERVVSKQTTSITSPAY